MVDRGNGRVQHRILRYHGIFLTDCLVINDTKEVIPARLFGSARRTQGPKIERSCC
ncbi:MAG: hypothetical protein ACLTBV_08450 [Enterocloster bolteae]